jgi:hypothetical protein
MFVKIYAAFQTIGAAEGLSAMGVPFGVNFLLGVLIGWTPVIGTALAIFGAVREWDLPLWLALSLWAIPLWALSIFVVRYWPDFVARLRKIKAEMDTESKSTSNSPLRWLQRVMIFLAAELVLCSLGWILAFGFTGKYISYPWLMWTGESASGMAVESWHLEGDQETPGSDALKVKFKTRTGESVTTWARDVGFPAEYEELEPKYGERPRGRPVPVQIKYSPRNPEFIVVRDKGKEPGWIAFRMGSWAVGVWAVFIGMIVHSHRENERKERFERRYREDIQQRWHPS